MEIVIVGLGKACEIANKNMETHIIGYKGYLYGSYIRVNFYKYLREEKRLSQSQLGEKIGVSNKTVSRWESGDGEPSLDLLISLAEILDVSADRLISGKSYASGR